MKTFPHLSAIFVLGVGLMSAANAAQQCFHSGGPTVYGAVTVTVSGCNDYGGAFAPFGVNESQLISSGATCTYTFSKPLLTSSLTVQVNSLDMNAALTISTSAGAYTSAAGDIGGPLPGSGSTNPIVLNGTGYIGGANEASGTLTLTNSPPASITSVSISQSGAASASLLKVCADDGGVVPGPATAASIPTLSEWGTALTAALLAVVTAVLNRRRNRHVSK